MRKYFIFSVLVLLFSGPVSPSAWAATITVNTTSDELNSDGDCSLREAINAANSNGAVDACTAGSGTDTIVVPAGTYTLTLFQSWSEDSNNYGDLDINSNLNLSGAGAGTTIIDASGLNPYREHVLQITGAYTVTLSGVTITGGLEGAAVGAGGVLNYGALTLTNCVVTGNSYTGSSDGGGGIRNLGTPLTITNSTISNNSSSANGGGLYNGASSSTITITGSTISGNSSTSIAGSSGGGGLYNNASSSTLTITNSTISNNSASGSGGGGLYNGGSSSSITITGSTISGNSSTGTSLGGGGILNDAGASTIIIANSTLSGNWTNVHGGGLLHKSGTAYLNNVTIAGNGADHDNNSGGAGGGLMNYGATVYLKNTLIADNNNNLGNEPDCSGILTTDGYNLIETNSDGCYISSTGSMSDSLATGDVTGQAPQLAALADEGGDTEVMALQAGSPAIDAGDPSGCKDKDGGSLGTDQRGETRPTDGNANGTLRCDIGAFEYTTCGDLVVQTDEECDDGFGNSDTTANACRTDCTNPSCGDGVTDTGEGCDDGNTSNTDACWNTCISATCGDGTLQSGVEECDDGNGNSNTAANACRTSCLNAYCGDGIIDTDEECDDGNTAFGDGCSETCQTEEAAEEEEATEIEATNPNVDFDTLSVGESISLNAPDPRTDSMTLTLMSLKGDSLPASCSCLWSLSPETLGSYSDAAACETILTPQESGSGTLTVAVDCGPDGSGTYLQTLSIGGEASDEQTDTGTDGSLMGGGCALIPSP